MTLDEAKKIIENSRNDGEWIGSVEEGDDTIILDGHFGVRELEAAIVLLRGADTASGEHGD